MKSQKTLLSKAILYLAITSSSFLLFIIIATPLHQQQIFFERDSFSLIEVLILIGFMVIIPFTIISNTWLIVPYRISNNKDSKSIFLILLGFFCIIAFAGEKVMIDEIARETKLGWETLGEWIILYILFAAQLTYCLLIFKKA